MEAYLDNSATTKCSEGVIELMTTVMRTDFGNPSSLHSKGVEAEKYIKYAKSYLAKNLKVNEKELVFTSGGTESNNLALIGSALANQRRGKHIITTSIEHASVYEPMFYLEKLGFEVSYLNVNNEGIIDLEQLKKELRDDTILVSVMHVNNEIGSVQPVEEAASIIHEKSKEILFHVDAIQSYGKFRIYPKKMGIDLLSVSGHKIHGPKGSGFLYIREKAKVTPQILGGGQQKDMRSGTENVPGIAGIAKAAEELYDSFEENTTHLRNLRAYFIEQITEQVEEITINGGSGENAAPHIVSVSFAGIRAEVLLHSLAERGVYVSSGSACSSNHPAISGTLKAIGVKKELLDSTLRFSFHVHSTIEEVDYAIAQLKELVPVLRKYRRH